MRTLNRPMFNMGGPIKQGIMHGIREPYAGGQLVQPGPGRPGYQGDKIPKSKLGWAGKVASWFPGGAKLVSNIKGGTKNILPHWSKLNPFKTPKPSGNINPAAWKAATTHGITGSKLGQQFMRNLKSFSFPGSTKALDYAKRVGTYPFRKPKRSLAAAYALSSDPAREAMGYVGKNIPNIIKSVTPNWIERMLSGEDKDAATDGFLKSGAAGGASLKGIAEKPSPVDLLLAGAGKDNEKFALAERNKRVKKYLDLMGYDRAKKTAIGDALIDASKIVSDRGSLDLKNITRELINPVIQSTSKRLDKPGQIREAVGLMMTKADLEKEMYDAKPGTVLKNVQDMIKSGIPKDEAWAIATKGSKGVVSDLQSALSTGKMSAADWPAFVRATGAEHGEEVSVVTKKQLKEKGMDEMTSEEVIASIGGGDGIFIIGDETIRIIGGKATQIK